MNQTEVEYIMMKLVSSPLQALTLLFQWQNYLIGDIKDNEILNH